MKGRGKDVKNSFLVDGALHRPGDPHRDQSGQELPS